MAQSSISGRDVPLRAAIVEAARLIASSRRPHIAGLGTDVAGAKAAIALAQRIGGSIDHQHGGALLRDLDAMREYGVMQTTPGEARLRADVVFLVGGGLADAGLWDIWPNLSAPPSAIGAASAKRRCAYLCADAVEGQSFSAAAAAKGVTIDVSLSGGALSQQVAALRARVNRRPVALAPAPTRRLDELAGILLSAHYGVCVWSARHIHALTIEMLCGLIKDLNAATRFTSLPLQPGDNAAGAQLVAGGMTGLPLRTGFGRGFAEHDPQRFATKRLMASGEADCAIWISAYGGAAPHWGGSAPVIALCHQATTFEHPPAVAIRVGCPGVDHASVDYFHYMGTLSSRLAAEASQTPSVAEILAEISAAIDASQAPPPC